MRVPFLGLVEPIRVYYIAILITARVEHPLASAILVLKQMSDVREHGCYCMLPKLGFVA